MGRRLIILALLVASVLQGPPLTYAATLASTGVSQSMALCADYTLSSAKTCKDCCGSGSMPSCVTQCAVPGAAIPVTSETVRIALPSTLIPDPGVAPFAERFPSHPFRPPIV